MTKDAKDEKEAPADGPDAGGSSQDKPGEDATEDEPKGPEEA
jgi:hypothetical protein